MITRQHRDLRHDTLTRKSAEHLFMNRTLTRLYFYGLTLSASALILFSWSCKLEAREPSLEKLQASGKIASSRPFKMGFVPVPQQSTPGQSSVKDWLETFSLIQQNAEFVLHHTHLSKKDWSDFANSPDVSNYEAYAGIEFVVLMAKERNLDVLMVIDPLTSNRENISENPFAAGFHDLKIRAAIQNFSLRVTRDYRRLTGKDLKYLAVGSEINTYMKFHPDDAANVTTLYRKTRALVKSEFPNTKVTCTFQYELLAGVVDGRPQWQFITQFGSDLDVFAFTTYPSAFFNAPEAIFSNYYRQLGRYTKKPLIIAESGWPSEGDPAWHGSLKNQKRFITQLRKLTSGLNLELWIWWFLHDAPGEGYPAYFRTMGLRTIDGNAKPSWNAWAQIAAGKSDEKDFADTP